MPRLPLDPIFVKIFSSTHKILVFTKKQIHIGNDVSLQSIIIAIATSKLLWHFFIAFCSIFSQAGSKFTMELIMCGFFCPFLKI